MFKIYIMIPITIRLFFLVLNLWALLLLDAFIPVYFLTTFKMRSYNVFNKVKLVAYCKTMTPHHLYHIPFPHTKRKNWSIIYVNVSHLNWRQLITYILYLSLLFSSFRFICFATFYPCFLFDHFLVAQLQCIFKSVRTTVNFFWRNTVIFFTQILIGWFINYTYTITCLIP